MDIAVLYVALPILAIVLIVIYVVKVFRKHESEDFNSVIEDFEVLEILVPRSGTSEVNASAFAAEHLFASLHGLLKEEQALQEHFSFEIASDHSNIRFYVIAPRNILKFVESQVYAQYPTAKIQISPDYAKKEQLEGLQYKVAHVGFEKEDYFPLKIFKDFEVDPLSNLMSTLSEIRPGESLWLQLMVKPIPDGWQDEGKAYIDFITLGKPMKRRGLGIAGFIGGFFSGMFVEIFNILADIPVAVFRGPTPIPEKGSAKSGPEKIVLNQFEELEVSLVKDKMTKMGFEVLIRVVSIAADEQRVDTNLRAVAASLRQYSTTSSNSFKLNFDKDPNSDFEEYQNRKFDTGDAIILNSEEIATLYHLPASREEAPNVSWVYSKSGEPPAHLPTEDCTYIGETMFRGKRVRFGIENGDDRLRHMYLIGKTGSGKSTLLNLMINQDIANGHGVGVLDPHGETIDTILEKIPDHRKEDVVIFDPSDTERPVGLNLLEIDDQSQKNLMASALLSAIKQHFDFSWGPRLEYLLNYALLTLLEVPGSTMLGITRLLEDQNYQNYILHQVNDPVVQRFWEKEYKEMKGNQKLVTEAIAPIQNKVNRFLSSSTIRNILVQRKSTIDIWDIMQSKKILLMNLSKGKIGSDNANLLGALLVSRIQFMALQRAKIAPAKRVPFYLYVDEFQNFATGSFEEILSESRKYKLGLYMTHQYTAQLPEPLMKAVFGNVGTIATFSLGAPDARELANEFAPYFDAEDIISLERFHIYIKMMVDGMTTLPFSAKILLPWMEKEMMPDTNNKDEVLQMSRNKYGTDKEYVEEVISRWVSRPFDKGMAIAQDHKKNNT